MKSKLIFILALVAACSLADTGRVGRIYWENDFPFHDDSDYTDGFRLEYEAQGISFFIQQLMYTPSNVRLPYQEGSHPYGGYLGVGASMELDSLITHRLYELKYFEVHTGTTGPHSGAEWTQKKIHKIVGAHQPVGWDTQIPNEWQIQGVAFYGYEYILLGKPDRWNLRVSDQFGGHLGTIQIAAENRATLKFGYGNDLNRHIGNIETREPKPSSAYYILVGNETKRWFRNVFLDGLRDSPSVDRENWTTALKTGLVADTGRFQFGLFALFSTREYKTQKNTPNYMSFQISYGF